MIPVLLIPVLLFPQFDPVIVQLGPLSIRWYALAYITALVIGWRLVRRFAALSPAVATPLQVDDFLTWATLGVVLGGRLGYVLFYQPSTYLAHPGMILAVWEGGMSFHGGMLGVAIAIIVFCRRNAIAILGFADRIAIVAPIGLGLGRVANFINGELWGRPAPLWWPGAMVFPYATPAAQPSSEAYEMLRQTACAQLIPAQCVPRYPSQLYEALLEGVLLFAIMFVLSRREALRARFGLLTGLFLCGYAVARIIGEYFREPDAFLGFLRFGTTMGQLLSVPMLVAGLWLIARARPHAVVMTNPAKQSP
jgi:phosphatidylglycerol:prolipoprotein diacylglycerol transferase